MIFIFVKGNDFKSRIDKFKVRDKKVYTFVFSNTGLNVNDILFFEPFFAIKIDLFVVEALDYKIDMLFQYVGWLIDEKFVDELLVGELLKEVYAIAVFKGVVFNRFILRTAFIITITIINLIINLYLLIMSKILINILQLNQLIFLNYLLISNPFLLYFNINVVLP